MDDVIAYIRNRISISSTQFYAGTPCWNWTLAKDKDGYGYVGNRTYIKRLTNKAHRLSWIAHVGPIPDGQFVCHKCDNPSCVNYLHFFLGSTQDNTADMYAKGRQARGIRNNGAKLTEAEVNEIRQLHAESNLTYDEIGEIYGVVKSTVSFIVNRIRWRHLA